MKLENKIIRRRSLVRAENLVVVALAALFITFSWWIIGLNYASHRNLAGQVSGTSSDSQNDYKSLDLSLARKAEFTSQAIKKLSSSTLANGAQKSVFSFGVPHDNLVEKGLMLLPSAPAPAGGYPVIILCHGYANPWSYSTESAYLPDMAFYASHGYAVLKPDFRGQGLSIPDGRPEGAYYSMGYNTDMMSLIAAVKRTAYLNPDKINLWGHSMGAYIALRAAVISPDVKKVVLLSGPVASFTEMYQDYIAVSDTQNPTAANIRLDALNAYGTPLTNPGFWAKASPINYLNGTRASFQIHVGSNDELVPPKFSAELDGILTKDGKKHEYYYYAGGDHGLLAERSQIYQRSLSFLQSN